MQLQAKNSELAELLEAELAKQHGMLISGRALRVALGFTTDASFRQSLSRDALPIPVFRIPHRRGKFALVKDLAHWLASQRNAALQRSTGFGEEETSML